MRTKKEVKKEISKLHDELSKIEELEIKKLIPTMISNVGKCYVYLENSYGGNSKKWNVYKRIIDAVVDNSGSVQYIVEEFQLISQNGACEYEVKKDWIYPDGREIFAGYVECSTDEYMENLDKFWAETKTQKTIRKLIKE